MANHRPLMVNLAVVYQYGSTIIRCGSLTSLPLNDLPRAPAAFWKVYILQALIEVVAERQTLPRRKPSLCGSRSFWAFFRFSTSAKVGGAPMPLGWWRSSMWVVVASATVLVYRRSWFRKQAHWSCRPPCFNGFGRSRKTWATDVDF